MSFLPIDILKSGAQEMGVQLSDEQIQKMDEFARILVEVNRELNLTRITEPEEIVIQHYLDSLTPLAAVKVPQRSTLVDIGTGAGFPGIPIKIARSDIAVTLMDSSLKRLKFIESALEILKLEGVDLVHARGEGAGRNAKYRDKFDFATARALSEMRVLAELCLPLVRVGGCLIALKGADVEEELNASRALIGQLGGRIDSIKNIDLPNSDITRKLIIVSKTKPTPQQFPRTYAQIIRRKS